MKLGPLSRVAAALASALLLSACMTSPAPSTAGEPADRSAAVAGREGAIELAWQPPEDRLSGTPLRQSEIAGYRIYLGEEPGRYTRTVEVKDSARTQYVLRGLTPGETYYVALTTLDREGRESPKSAEVSIAAAPLSDTQLAESEQRETPPER